MRKVSLALTFLTGSTAMLRAQSSPELNSVIGEVAEHQAAFLKNFGTGLRYLSRWHTADEDNTAEVIGSTDGLVALQLTHNGKPLGQAESAKEQARLQALLPPGKVRASNKAASRLQPYFLEIVQAMPRAMFFAKAPSQPQIDGLAPQLVIDYSPDPAFRPHSLAEATLRNLSGRVWVDSKTHRLLKMVIHVDRDVTIAGGLLIRVYRGGSVEYDQRSVDATNAAAPESWTHIRLRLSLRELLLHTTRLDADLSAEHIEQLSQPLDGTSAVRALLTRSTP